MNFKQLICPVSDKRVNEHVIRVNALFTILLVVAGIYFKLWFLLLYLMVEFYLRAFTQVRGTPVGLLSQWLVSTMNWEPKPIDKAPKIFAARLGFLMTFAIIALYVAGFTNASLVVAGVLTFFATLELVLGFCAGCYLYTLLLQTKLTRSHRK